MKMKSPCRTEICSKKYFLQEKEKQRLEQSLSGQILMMGLPRRSQGLCIWLFYVVAAHFSPINALSYAIDMYWTFVHD